MRTKVARMFDDLNTHLLGMSAAEKYDAMQILSAIRGPDDSKMTIKSGGVMLYSDTLKYRTTGVIRGKVFNNDAVCDSGMTVYYDPSEEVIEDALDLGRRLHRYEFFNGTRPYHHFGSHICRAIKGILRKDGDHLDIQDDLQ